MNTSNPLVRIRQRAFLGLFINPFRKSAQTVELDGDRVRIIQRGTDTSLSLQSLAAPPTLRRGLFTTTLSISSANDDTYTLYGAGHIAARDFAEALKTAWVRFNLAALKKEAFRLDRIIEDIEALARPTKYPAACSVSPLLDDARALNASLLSKLPPEAIGPEAVARIGVVRKFVDDPRTARAQGIAAFVAAELDRWKVFLDTIENNPLTPEQRLSIVVDEDATLVLAGAGSGKTSVITAKAAYLVKAGIRRPEEILLLAFAKNAAAEMSERVEARSGMPIVARTFHALAYDIIGIVEGTKPALADHATDDVAFTNLIKQILKDQVKSLSEVSKAIIQWFAHFLVETKTEWDFETKHDFYTHERPKTCARCRAKRSRATRSYRSLTGSMRTVSNTNMNPSTSIEFRKPAGAIISQIFG